MTAGLGDIVQYRLTSGAVRPALVIKPSNEDSDQTFLMVFCDPNLGENRQVGHSSIDGHLLYVGAKYGEDPGKWQHLADEEEDAAVEDAREEANGDS